MTQTPQTPAGWYPEGGVERWWDGNAWSAHTRPLPGTADGRLAATARRRPTALSSRDALRLPAGAPGQEPPRAQPAHRLRVLFLIFVGGCVAIVALVGNEVDNAVNDDTPGGPNNPLTIEPGEAFEVAGFEYADGWTLGADVAGLLSVEGLKVRNDRGKTDQALVTISVLLDDVVLADTDLHQRQPDPRGPHRDPDLLSGDSMPADYDEITIKDVI